MTRRRGFTLIELLVVIAIIGILAAMLFPVFARARESARKTQCLANVKNLAIAINMYLVDYDDFFPTTNDDQNDAVAQAYFADYGETVRGKDPDDLWPHCNHIRQGNPYLREPVILDDYTKNRDIWRCPSAKVSFTAKWIVPAGRGGYWVNNFVDHPSWYDDKLSRPCQYTFPSGWGGSVTDSFTQGAAPDGEPQAFAAGLGINDSLASIKASAVNDAARLVAVGEAGVSLHPWNANLLAYPDVCYVSNCGYADGCTAEDTGCHADWENCPSSRQCGLDAAHQLTFFQDSNYRKQWTRHLGGANVGFADGHAKWYPAEALINGACGTKDPQFEGDLCPCWWPSLLAE